VWRWLERLGIPVRDRSDVRQDVFLAAHQSWSTYNPLRARPEGWLNQITVHVAAHYRSCARHRREVLISGDVDEVADGTPGASDLMADEQRRLMVLELLHTLDADLRALLIAHDLDEVPMAEVAEQFGIPLSTAYKWRARALAAFHEAAEKRRREEDREDGGDTLAPG
jgi:RNA polymerase sigma factor (sigma-70 family)